MMAKLFILNTLYVLVLLSGCSKTAGGMVGQLDAATTPNSYCSNSPNDPSTGCPPNNPPAAACCPVSSFSYAGSSYGSSNHNPAFFCSGAKAPGTSSVGCLATGPTTGPTGQAGLTQSIDQNSQCVLSAPSQQGYCFTCSQGSVGAQDSSGTYCLAPADLQYDSGNCGTIGNVCSQGSLCYSGQCYANLTYTPGASSPWNCASGYNPVFAPGSFGQSGPFLGCYKPNDTKHCGSQNQQCLAGQSCSLVGGQYQCVCPSTTPDLQPGVGCFNFATDSLNCGSYGVSCNSQTSGETCKGGVCSCQNTHFDYNPATGVCVDFQNDNNNCGGFNQICPTGSSCQSGVCNCSVAGQLLCNNQCISPSNANCGACGAACPTGSGCNASLGASGVCVMQTSYATVSTTGSCIAVGTGTTQAAMCNGTNGPVCTDLMRDPANCGTCGNAVSAGDLCCGGKIISSNSVNSCGPDCEHIQSCVIPVSSNVSSTDPTVPVAACVNQQCSYTCTVQYYIYDSSSQACWFNGQLGVLPNDTNG